ncbi:sensor histidine kinase [Streptomyces sp. NPDC059009]|uniref:sensor histidine kinase n=1 Tax=Streptomyces sp. NPDC059009 TaxID=3346694 RepID=UPI003675ABEF
MTGTAPSRPARFARLPRNRLPRLPRLPRFPRASVRVKTTVGAVLIVAVALVAASTALLMVIHHGLEVTAEHTARTRAEAVAEATRTGHLAERLSVPQGEDSLLQVVTDDSRVLAASENLAGRAAVASFVPADGRTSAARSVRVAPRQGGAPHPYRLVAVRTTSADGPATVYAGTSLETAEYTRNLVLTAMIPGIPLLLALVAAVTWRSTGRALRPVEAIRSEVAEITEHDLGRRVPVPASRDEVARLSRTMNDTLDRLQDSMDRQRGFVADASHELRNPIAALRAHVEVAIAHPDLLRGPELLSDVVRVQQLADDLLLLARLDAGQHPDRTALDLGELCERTLARRPPGRVRVSLDTEPGVVAAASRSQLSRVLDNLLDNAQRHARSRITVTTATEPDDGSAVLTVTNDGTPVAEADRERIFARFTRLDESRSRDAGGSGLGLAIARDIATAHGGTLTAGPPVEGRGTEGQGVAFTLRLPSVAVAPPYGAVGGGVGGVVSRAPVGGRSSSS